MDSKGIAASFPRSHPLRRWRPWMLAIAWFIAGVIHAAPKTDVVVLANGDRITGEIKKLERGLLTLKTDTLGTIEIEWPSVARIESKQRLEFESSDHERHAGHVVGADASGALLLADGEDAAASVLSLAAVVEITPLSEGRWWDRIDGSLGLGVNAASANDDRKWSASVELSYRDEKHRLDASYDAARTESSNNPDLKRRSGEALYRWFPHERRFWAVFGGMESNDELGLELRSLGGVGIGGYALRDARRELWGFVGLAATRERYRDKDDADQFEGVLRGAYDLFRFDDPELDISAELALYPSLSTGGRMRSELSLRARVELVKDLYYELSYQRSEDNRPPGGEGEEVDWSLLSSFGYKF